MANPRKSRAKPKGAKRYYYAKSVPRKQPKVSQAERVSWALARLRAAIFQRNLHKEDRALALAVESRRAEYDRERETLARSTHITPEELQC